MEMDMEGLLSWVAAGRPRRRSLRVRWRRVDGVCGYDVAMSPPDPHKGPRHLSPKEASDAQA